MSRRLRARQTRRLTHETPARLVACVLNRRNACPGARPTSDRQNRLPEGLRVRPTSSLPARLLGRLPGRLPARPTSRRLSRFLGRLRARPVRRQTHDTPHPPGTRRQTHETPAVLLAYVLDGPALH